jgi:hypothetical protein
MGDTTLGRVIKSAPKKPTRKDLVDTIVEIIKHDIAQKPTIGDTKRERPGLSRLATRTKLLPYLGFPKTPPGRTLLI